MDEHNYDLGVAAGGEDLDITLISSGNDTLWLDYWSEYFDIVLDDIYLRLADYGVEDLLVSCPITVTDELPPPIMAEYVLVEDRLYINYVGQPKLESLLRALGLRFFFGLDSSVQEDWIISVSEGLNSQDPRTLFQQIFAAFFLEDAELEDEVAEIFYRVSDLEYQAED